MNLQILASSHQQIDAIVASITLAVSELLKTKETITIALSGGKSPIPMLEKLSTIDLDFSKITFTLVDERIVDVQHQDSNENLIRTYLLKNKASNANFIGLSGNASSGQLISQANAAIKHIDLAVLGMGEDGHTASIFPECSELHDALDLSNKNTYILTTPLSAKYTRISLTLAALIQIPHLLLSITGNTKLNVLKEAILGDNLNYPISYILSRKPSTKIFWAE